VLLDVPTEMQKLVRDRTQFDANARISLGLLELLDKLRMLHEGKSMPDALGLEHYCIIEIRVVRISRATSIEEGFPGMEQKRNFAANGITCLLECDEFFFVEANVVRSILRTY
jgi:hypothetical protein